MLDQIILGLSVLAGALPVGAVIFTVGSLSDRRVPKWVSVPLGLALAASILVGEWFLYEATGFPGWMRWPHEWLG